MFHILGKKAIKIKNHLKCTEITRYTSLSLLRKLILSFTLVSMPWEGIAIIYDYEKG